MKFARVIGTVVASQKYEGLEGVKFLIVQPYNLNKDPNTDTIVAADILGAGEGELVADHAERHGEHGDE